MTRQQLYSLKIGETLTNKILNTQFKVSEKIAYGTYLLINQTDLICEYINPSNCSIYTKYNF